jgi:serine O-acetyltransferase
MVRELWRDAVEFSRVARKGDVSPGAVLRTALVYDGFAVLAMTRVRQAANRLHLPLVNRALRILQTAVYGIEIGKDVTLGEGVYFVHPLGTVIGGDAKVGDRVRFLGSNTVGTAKDNGYPVIEDDVLVGCGARILGPVRVGAGAVIGANAVVLHDVPPGAVAVGVPAVVHLKGGDPAGAAPAGKEATS